LNRSSTFAPTRRRRALLLLGAAAAGYDLGDCRADLGRLLGEELAPQVRTAVEALYPGNRTAAGQPAYARPTAGLPPKIPPAPALPLDDDPLAGVEIEV
jgi:hypothetical protein